MMNDDLKNQFYNKVAMFEGFRSRPYRCPAGILTIGYGHTDGVKITDKVTIDQAKELLRADFRNIHSQLGCCPFILQEHELWAISDFIYNVGFTKFKKSSLYPLLQTYSNALDKHNFSYADTLKCSIVSKIQEFVYYTSPNGNKVMSEGLKLRRFFETDLFSNCHIY